LLEVVKGEGVGRREVMVVGGVVIVVRGSTPRDSVHLLGCMQVARWAGGGISVGWMSSIF
jgi:hypothetical protein